MNKKTKMLLKSNNVFEEDNLSEHSQEIMTDIVCYLRGSDLSEYNQELIRKDINYMIADGESRGESIENVIGRDYQNFCDDIISTFPKKTWKEKVIDTISNCAGSVSIIMFIWFVGAFVRTMVETKSIHNLYITLGEIIGITLMVIEAVVIVQYIMSTALKEEKEQSKKQKRKTNIILFLVLFAAISIPMLFYTLMKEPAFPITMPVVILFIVLPLMIRFALSRIEQE